MPLLFADRSLGVKRVGCGAAQTAGYPELEGLTTTITVVVLVSVLHSLRVKMLPLPPTSCYLLLLFH